MKLEFGKHKGQDICDIPVDYLIWVEENVTNLSPNQRDEINIEIERRTGDRSSIGVQRNRKD